MRLYEYRYTYSTGAQAYVNHPGIGCALAHRFCMAGATTNPAAPADFPPPPREEGRGGVRPYTADAAKTTETDHSLTYTTSAQVYVKHMGTGCALAHRRLPNYPTIARSPTALLPLPVGLKQLARSERKGWGEGSKKSSVASTIDLYRDHFTCPNTTEHTARNPTPALPHRGRESFRCSSTFRALNNHSARASAHRLCPEKRSRAAFLLPLPQPSPTGGRESFRCPSAFRALNNP